jgi:hypothetical protein
MVRIFYKILFLEGNHTRAAAVTERLIIAKCRLPEIASSAHDLTPVIANPARPQKGSKGAIGSRHLTKSKSELEMDDCDPSKGPDVRQAAQRRF